jgi:hypothetical protein
VMAVFSATWQIPCEWEESNMVDYLRTNYMKSTCQEVVRHSFDSGTQTSKPNLSEKMLGNPTYENCNINLKLHPDPIMSITTTNNILLEMSSCTSEICIFWRIADCCEALNLGWAKNGHKNRSNVGRTNA